MKSEDASTLSRGTGFPKNRRATPGVLGVVVAVLLLCYIGLMLSRMGLCAGASDSSGYVNSAKLLREGRIVVEQRQIEDVSVEVPWFTYTPLGFAELHAVHGRFDPANEGRMVPTYPMGLPLLFAAASVGTSLDTGMLLVMTLTLVGNIVLTYRLGRQLSLPRGWATLGAGILALCPIFQGASIQAMSDAPSTFWTTLTLVLALDSNRRKWLAAPAGAAIALAVFLRPSNALVVIPLFWALRSDWRRWLYLAMAGLPGAILWVLVNKYLFGTYITTGYGDVSNLFAWHNLLPALGNYAVSLRRALPLALFAALGWGRPRTTNERVALGVVATWALLLPAFYSFYYYTHLSWAYLRFILPALPALVALSVRGLRRALRWAAGPDTAPRPILGAAALAVATLVAGYTQIRASLSWDALDLGREELRYGDINKQLAKHAPDNAVVFCMQTSGAMYYRSPWVIVRWDCISAEVSRELYAAAERAGRPVYAALYPFEIEGGCFGKNLAGHWTQIDRLDDKTFWKLDSAEGSMP